MYKCFLNFFYMNPPPSQCENNCVKKTYNFIPFSFYQKSEKPLDNCVYIPNSFKNCPKHIELSRKNIKALTEDCEQSSDLEQVRFKTGKDGFYREDGEDYANTRTWEKELKECKISRPAIQNRLEKAGIEPIQGMNWKGKPCKLYKKSDVERVCADKIEERLLADEYGAIKHNGMEYRTIEDIKSELGISHKSVSKRLKGITPLKGRNHQFTNADYYPYLEALELCRDITRDLSRADEDGFIHKNGVRYATCKRWAKEFKEFRIDSSTIQSKLNEGGAKSIIGRDINRAERIFYSENDVKKYCEDFLTNFSEHTDDGGIIYKGNTYYTAYGISKLTGISPDIIRAKINGSLNFINWKDKQNRNRKYYREDKTHEVIQDEINKKREKIKQMIASGSLPKYRIKPKTQIHQGLAGDSVLIIPKHFKAIYKEIADHFDLTITPGSIIGLIEKKPVLLSESELENVNSQDKRYNSKTQDQTASVDTNKLYEENIKMIHSIINKKFYWCDKQAKQDFENEAVIALLRATDKFDVSKGTKFKSFAYKVILNHLTRYYQDTHSIVREPNHIQESRWQMRRYFKNFYNLHQREPNIKDVMAEFGVEEEKASTLIKIYKEKNIFSSFEEAFSDIDNRNLHDVIKSEEAEMKIALEFEKETRKKMIVECKKIILKECPGPNNRNWKVFLWRFGLTQSGEIGEHLDFSSIAEKFGISKQAIQQSFKPVLVRLQKRLNKKKIDVELAA